MATSCLFYKDCAQVTSPGAEKGGWRGLETIIGLVIGLVVGGVIGWLFARARGDGGAESARLQAQVEDRDARVEELLGALEEKEGRFQAVVEEKSRLDGDRRVVEEKLVELKDLHGRFEQTFKVLAGDTLKANSESLTGLARREFEKAVGPVSETLKRYEEGLRAVEKSRTEAYGGLNEQLKSIARQYEVLGKETGNLTKALRNPQVQGQWGEFTLKNTVELAGMSEYCDFTEQVSTSVEGGRLRPDMVVRLPAGREIVVDAKAPLNAYMDAMNAQTDAERQAKFKEHAAKVRDHVRKLAGKDYAGQFAQAPEFTVLFLPAENFFSAAALGDRGLLEEAMKRGIILASPTTLVALLLAVAHGWRQAQLEENARKISGAGRELFERLSTFAEHLHNVGAHLAGAEKAYNKAVGSFDTRLRPAAQRMTELGATGGKALPELPPVDGAVRGLAAQDEGG